MAKQNKQNKSTKLTEEDTEKVVPSAVNTTEPVEVQDNPNANEEAVSPFDEEETTEEDFKNAEPADEEEEDEEEVKPVAKKQATPKQPAKQVEAPLSNAKVEGEARNREMSVKQMLASQPRVRMFIPLGIGEKKNGMAYVPVTINGYRTEVPKGEYVDVPQGIADILAESQNQTVNAGNEWKIDLDDDKQKALA